MNGYIRLLGAAITLALATFLIYLPVRHNDFLNWDDQSYVTANDHVRGGITARGIIWAFTESHSGNWHPLTWLSHMLDCQLFGLNSSAHHLVNAAFHAINAGLLLLLLNTLTGSLWRSAVVAAIFAFHPLRVESVAWVAERKDLLCGFFGLLTLIAYIRYANLINLASSSHSASSGTKLRKSKCFWYVTTLLLFVLGLMSKPMLVTWPFLMLILDWWPLRRMSDDSGSPKQRIVMKLVREKIPFFAFVILSCVITIWAQQKAGAVASIEQLPLSVRIQNAAIAYITYLEKFLWPTGLAAIQPHPIQLSLPKVALSVLLLGIITVTTWRLRKRQPIYIVGWLWFLGTLVPVIGIVQVGNQAWADRYTYLPLIGITAALIWLTADGLSRFHIHPTCTLGLSALPIGLLAWQTMSQLPIWKNDGILFRHTLQVHPRNPQALFGLGSYLIDHGAIETGRSYLKSAIEIEPKFTEAIGTLAASYDDQGDYEEAIHTYRSALAADPNNAAILNNLAWLLAACPDAKYRNGTEAVRLATRACNLTGYQKPLFIGTLAAAHAEAGAFDTAMATADHARHLAYALGLKSLGDRNHNLKILYSTGRGAHGQPPHSVFQTPQTQN